ncbi:ABC transporter substrate-binding protein [Cohnella pontilimi]|uniref:Chorismate dehydratase n=1 Tax=Cohnella pontilimi TaxID=2564100 RepID=A0A4U0FHE2_9BACL|nr:menaquinone biosynthesis protein [Cohnella pontilimi]TJY44348.1 ABC transporter substrate-binding protein [Cohnella pontilimi]
MTDGLSRPIRIGRIDYTNVWPVVHHFDPAALKHPAEQVQEMPAVLNRKLREGEIDLAAISSFAYGDSSESYYLLPDLSVSALGRVQSILLFLKSPLEKVVNGKIALTTTSATSVNLLKIIMEKFYGGKPIYEDAEPSLEKMLQGADAALLIGDHAIRASWQNHGYRVLDLGEVWNLWTGHWMTFAVWAVRREAARRNPEAVRDIFEGLTVSKRMAYRDLEPIVSKAQSQIGGTREYWQGYFRNLYHGFGPEQQAGLKLYYQYAHELGLIDHEVNLTEWPVAVAGNFAEPQVRK